MHKKATAPHTLTVPGNGTRPVLNLADDGVGERLAPVIELADRLRSGTSPGTHSDGPVEASRPGTRTRPQREGPSESPRRTGRGAAGASLDRMVRTSDLRVVFQPIVCVATGKVFAYEALVRCSTPPFTNPMKLFERAVEERCVGLLGRTIREIALPLCAEVPVFLNIHPRELSEKWLVRPDDPIYRHDDEIYLEVTEAVPFDEAKLCKSVLREIRERAGARLVVDDLGAGFSNLKYIADLEPAVVKLDRELIAGIDQRPRLQQLVCSLVGLCNELGAAVVAEGVETQAELACVERLGVAFAQGYFLARPSYPLPLADRVERNMAERVRSSTPAPPSKKR